MSFDHREVKLGIFVLVQFILNLVLVQQRLLSTTTMFTLWFGWELINEAKGIWHAERLSPKKRSTDFFEFRFLLCAVGLLGMMYTWCRMFEWEQYFYVFLGFVISHFIIYVDHGAWETLAQQEKKAEQENAADLIEEEKMD